MTDKLDQLFKQDNEMEQKIESKLLRKNKKNIKIKSLSKTTVLTIVALVGAAIFSFSFATLLSL